MDPAVNKTHELITRKTKIKIRIQSGESIIMSDAGSAHRNANVPIAQKIGCLFLLSTTNADIITLFIRKITPTFPFIWAMKPPHTDSWASYK